MIRLDESEAQVAGGDVTLEGAGQVAQQRPEVGVVRDGLRDGEQDFGTLARRRREQTGRRPGRWAGNGLCGSTRVHGSGNSMNDIRTASFLILLHDGRPRDVRHVLYDPDLCGLLSDEGPITRPTY